MKYRKIAYALVPFHTWYGYAAPAIYVEADNYDAARKEALKRCTLVRRFPEKWKLL